VHRDQRDGLPHGGAVLNPICDADKDIQSDRVGQLRRIVFVDSGDLVTRIEINLVGVNRDHGHLYVGRCRALGHRAWIDGQTDLRDEGRRWRRYTCLYRTAAA
jgi:hypothetical protein